MINQDNIIVPIPRKIEIGSPGNILLRFNPKIVIPVPKIIENAVKVVIIKLLVCNKALEVSIL